MTPDGRSARHGGRLWPSPASGSTVRNVKPRRCSRAACSATAVATLTYAYADSTAVLGPLSPFVEPHSYDLCAPHADRLTVPLGWAVVRIEGDPRRNPAADDLEALAEVVRESSRPAAVGEPPPDPRTPGGPRSAGGRPHLRVIPSSS
jgi:hypothetical protein